MTPPTDTAVRHVGELPLDHPIVQRLIGIVTKRAAEVAAQPIYEQHPFMGTYLDAVEGLNLLTQQGGTRTWLAWLDAFPPGGPGRDADPGQLLCAAYWQTGGFTVGHQSGQPLQADTDTDPKPGGFSRGMYRTNRRKQFTLDDGSILDLPVWRINRPDRPHKSVCTDACSDCGTGDYWNLPEYVWPEPSIGLADPDDPTRLAPAEKFLWALAGPRGWGKVVLTDHARFEHGGTGVPEPRRRGRVVRINETADGDRLLVRWNKNRGESVLRPTEVQRPASESPAG